MACTDEVFLEDNDTDTFLEQGHGTDGLSQEKQDPPIGQKVKQINVTLF